MGWKGSIILLVQEFSSIREIDCRGSEETTPSVSVKTTANGGILLLFLEEVECG